MDYAKAKALFVSYTSLQSYNTFIDIQTTLFQTTPNNGTQLSESIATLHLQSASPDSPVLSMYVCQKYISNMYTATYT